MSPDPFFPALALCSGPRTSPSQFHVFFFFLLSIILWGFVVLLFPLGLLLALAVLVSARVIQPISNVVFSFRHASARSPAIVQVLRIHIHVLWPPSSRASLRPFASSSSRRGRPRSARASIPKPSGDYTGHSIFPQSGARFLGLSWLVLKLAVVRFAGAPHTAVVF